MSDRRLSDRRARSDAADFPDVPGGGEIGWALVAFAWAFLAGGAAAALSGWPALVIAALAFAGFVWSARRWRLAVVDDAVMGALLRIREDAP